MHIIADVNEISKTVQRNLTFILNVLSESSIHFTQLSIVPAKKNVGIFTQYVFFEKRGCATVRNYVGACKGICSYNLLYNFLMQLFPLKILVFVAHFLNAFWHGKETFLKSSSQNEIVPLLIVFLLPYNKYKGLKKCFYLCGYKIKIFRSCRTRVVCVALVSHSYHSCSTRVALVSPSCRSCLALML